MEGQKGSSSLHSSNYRRSHSSADSRTRKKGYLDNSVGSIQTQSDASSNHSSSSCLSGSFKLAARQVADSFVSCFVPSRPNSIQEHSPHPHYSGKIRSDPFISFFPFFFLSFFLIYMMIVICL